MKNRGSNSQTMLPALENGVMNPPVAYCHAKVDGSISEFSGWYNVHPYTEGGSLREGSRSFFVEHMVRCCLNIRSKNL